MRSCARRTSRNSSSVSFVSGEKSRRCGANGRPPRISAVSDRSALVLAGLGVAAREAVAAPSPRRGRPRGARCAGAGRGSPGGSRRSRPGARASPAARPPAARRGAGAGSSCSSRRSASSSRRVARRCPGATRWSARQGRAARLEGRAELAVDVEQLLPVRLVAVALLGAPRLLREERRVGGEALEQLGSTPSRSVVLRWPCSRSMPRRSSRSASSLCARSVSSVTGRRDVGVAVAVAAHPAAEAQERRAHAQPRDSARPRRARARARPRARGRRAPSRSRRGRCAPRPSRRACRRASPPSARARRAPRAASSRAPRSSSGVGELKSSARSESAIRASLVRIVRRLASVGCAVNTGITSRRSSSDCISSGVSPRLAQLARPPRRSSRRRARRRRAPRARAGAARARAPASSARLTSLK